MLKPTVKRGLMLDFIRKIMPFSAVIERKRVFKLNKSAFADGDVVYMPTRELRFYDNPAINFGIKLADRNNKNFKIIVIKSQINFSPVQKGLIELGIKQLMSECNRHKIKCSMQEELPDKIGALIVDFNPLTKNDFNVKYPIYELDSHNIIPARVISDKQEYSAATIRRKIYANIQKYLTEFECPTPKNQMFKPINILNNFIKYKLNFYENDKNDTKLNGTSGLSPYLTFGLISSRRIAIEVIKSNACRASKEAFLEELIVRKELSDNFCLYASSHKTFDNIPLWAKNTLEVHKNDIRTYVYSQNQFEFSKTHDKLWNQIQAGLVKTGKIHGYLRMIWGKKILEWTNSPEEALKIAIYLNDKYALDGNSPNGYVGILWALGGLHDRPFTNRFVTGKIRYMKGSF